MSLQAVHAALAGPPRLFVLDRETYELVGPWSLLLTILPTDGWRDQLLFELLHPEDALALEDRLLDDDDPFGLYDLRDLAERLVGVACARPWWVAEKLLSWAASDWPQVDGTLRLAGVDLLDNLDRNPTRALNVLYALIVQNRDEQDRAKIDAELEMPPPDAEPTEEMEAAEGDMFLAAMATHQRPGARG